MKKLQPHDFTFELWSAGSLTEFNIPTRTYSIEQNRQTIREHAIGYMKGTKLWVRPKIDTVAVMFSTNNITFWTHLTTKEFIICFPEYETNL
ncbi:MAG: hypothetical protein ACOCVF_01100 [bacterium]